MATTDPQRLEIHVFGAAKGESIVLRLPTGEWGVVDCYSSSQNDSDNPTYQFLLANGVERLAFLCLTHPHDDHFSGMTHLLNRFSVQCFWRPAAMFGRRLLWILDSEADDADMSGIAASKASAKELEEIFELVKKKKQESGRPAISKASTTGTQLFPVPVNTASEFQIWAIAPTARQTDKYENALRKCFDHEHRLIDPKDKPDHNIVSMALLIIYGTTRVILGGDVETAGWREALEEFGATNLSSHAVKISHHGSTNGYSEGLWPSIAKQHKPITFLTAYRSHRLPRKAALEHIREFSSRIATTCLSAVHADEIPAPLTATSPAELVGRAALRRKTNARPEEDYPVGRCSFVFDNTGNCIDETFDGDAGVIPI